jgi:CheY-like chemotaxis protein
MLHASAPGTQGTITTGSRPAVEHASDVLPTLLNVEDFEPTRFLRTRLFRRAGYKVIEASCAGEALQAAARYPLTIALIDVNLPDASGITLCDTLKRLSPNLPVLLISALATDADLQQAAQAAGANGYLAEPVATDALLRTVAQAMNGEIPRQDVETWVVTDRQGFIIDSSSLGARMLSGTIRGLQHRSLLMFFEQDREGWRDAMMRAAQGERVLRAGRLRPKERRPIGVRVEIEKTTTDTPPALLWNFRPDAAD